MHDNYGRQWVGWAVSYSDNCRNVDMGLGSVSPAYVHVFLLSGG